MQLLATLLSAPSTYANLHAAYFFFGNDMYKDDFDLDTNTRNQNLFEDQQAMLEAAVECLSGLVREQPLFLH